MRPYNNQFAPVLQLDMEEGLAAMLFEDWATIEQGYLCDQVLAYGLGMLGVIIHPETHEEALNKARMAVFEEFHAIGETLEEERANQAGKTLLNQLVIHFKPEYLLGHEA